MKTHTKFLFSFMILLLSCTFSGFAQWGVKNSIPYVNGGLGVRDVPTMTAATAGTTRYMGIFDANNTMKKSVLPLVYTAIVTQTSTTAPTATVLKNELSYTVTWARTSEGLYTATVPCGGVSHAHSGSVALGATKTFFVITGATSISGVDTTKCAIDRLNDTTFQILHTYNHNGTVVDVFKAFVEVRVYP